jgi:metal transporter CNNM
MISLMEFMITDFFSNILLLVFLILASGLFSGLTIGLMGFSIDEIQRLSDLGNYHAKRILPLVKRSNLLLTTLLLGNTAVNSTIAIILGKVIGEGLIAGIMATGLILILGEITPAAVLSRHALVVGSRVSKLVHVLIFLFYPVAAPIAIILDKLLGQDLPELLTRRELHHIIETHHKANESDIDTLDRDLILGALSLQSITAKEIMTPKEMVVSISYKDLLTGEAVEKLSKTGFTRFPVLWDDRVVGILDIKKLVNFSKKISGKQDSPLVSELCKENKIIHVRSDIKVDDILYRMIKSRVHIAAVSDNTGWIGVITMEDIFEVLVGHEITDEYGH